MSLPEFWHRLPLEPELDEPAQTLAERGYKAGLVVHNPQPAYQQAYETYFHNAQPHAEANSLELICVPTLPDQQATIEAVTRRYTQLGLRPEEVFIESLGGDGTLNTTLQAAELLGGLAVHAVPIGTKNDFAHLTNTDETYKHPEVQLSRPVVLHPTYPLNVTVTATSGSGKAPTTLQVKAFQSYSDGLSANVANHVQQRAHREHKLIPIIGRNLLDKLVTFRLSLPHVVQRPHVRREDSWHRTVEFLVANTGQMAGEFYPDVEYDGRTARIIEAHDLVCAYLTTAALLARQPVGRLMPEELVRHIYAPAGLHGQVDGEPFRIPSGAVAVTIRKTPLNVPVPKLITPPGSFKHAGSRTKYRPKSVKK